MKGGTQQHLRQDLLPNYPSICLLTFTDIYLVRPAPPFYLIFYDNFFVLIIFSSLIHAHQYCVTCMKKRDLFAMNEMYLKFNKIIIFSCK